MAIVKRKRLRRNHNPALAKGRSARLTMCHIIAMPSVNMRQLRDTKRLKSWLRAGKTVELRERDRLIARIVPEKETQKQSVEWPDFAARRQQIFGDRTLPIVDDLINDRGRY